MACLYVSTKMHDTLKKPRDILMVSYIVRFPELAARSKVIGGEVEIDPAVCLSLNISQIPAFSLTVLKSTGRQSNRTDSTF